MSTDGFEEMCPNCVTPWKCNGPHEFPPVAPEPTADTAAEPEAGWPVWWNGGWCNENGTGRYAPLDVDSGEPWPIWSDMPGAVPAAVPSPEPPAQAPAAPLSLVEEAERDFPEQMRAAREEVRAQSGDHPPRTRPAPSLSQEPGPLRCTCGTKGDGWFQESNGDIACEVCGSLVVSGPAASQEPGETR